MEYKMRLYVVNVSVYKIRCKDNGQTKISISLFTLRRKVNDFIEPNFDEILESMFPYRAFSIASLLPDCMPNISNEKPWELFMF